LTATLDKSSAANPRLRRLLTHRGAALGLGMLRDAVLRTQQAAAIGGIHAIVAQNG